MEASQWDIALVQGGTQVNQLANAIDHAGNITNFTENRRSRSFFFFHKTQKRRVNFGVCHKKNVYQKNILFVKPVHIMYVFFKGIIGKTNCYWHVRFFFMCINTTFTLEPTITDLKLIRICCKTSSNNIYPFPTVYTRWWKRNDSFRFSGLRFSMIMTDAQDIEISRILCFQLFTLKNYKSFKTQSENGKK